jgi:hypothetical protein
MEKEKSADNFSVKDEKVYSALSEVLSQKMRSVLVRHPLHLCHELYDIAAALAVAETPESVEGWRDDEAAIGCVRAGRARASQLSACFLQLDAEHVADLLDRNSLPQGFEVHTLVGAHWCNLSVRRDRPMLFYQYKEHRGGARPISPDG